MSYDAPAGPPANWYPDPTGRFDHRYWDGATWTDDVARNGIQAKDALEQATATQSSTPAETVPAQLVVQTKQPGAIARLRNERRAKVAGRDQFESLAMNAAAGDPEAVSALPSAVADAKALYRGSKFESKAWEIMATAVRHVIADDILDPEEEEHIHNLGEILGTPVQAMMQHNFPLFEEMVIAGINDHRFPTMSEPPIMLKDGETAYGSFSAALMKEVTLREFQGRSQSVSVPLGHGVRYRVGGMRGHSVVVGTQLVPQDTGILVVTSARSVFVGQKKTLEFRNDKLLGVEQYSNGLRLNVSNRQTASLFTMPEGQSPSIAAALISASARQ